MENINKKPIVVEFGSNASEEHIKAFEDLFNLSNKKELAKDLNIFQYELQSTYKINSEDTPIKINGNEIQVYADPNYKYNLQIEPDCNLEWELKVNIILE